MRGRPTEDVERERRHPLQGTAPLKSVRAFASRQLRRSHSSRQGVNTETLVSVDEIARARNGPRGWVETMFADDIRRALQGTPRERLAELSAAVWKGFACGAVSEQDAQQLAEEIAARKIVPKGVVPGNDTLRRRVGSRPRSSESVERRRRWVASGWMPPALACRFTAGELSALSVVASQAAKHGRCDLALDHIAALAGVGRTTVRNALGEARRLGLLTVEVRRLRAFRNDTNVVRIASPEWQSWLSMRRSAPGQGVGANQRAPRDTHIFSERKKGCIQGARREAERRGRS